MPAFDPLIQLKLEEAFSEKGILATHYGLKRRLSQVDMVTTICGALAQNKGALIEAATGCHARGTLIMLANGQTKLVEEIEVGDTIMGWDSTPRKVLGLARGRQTMVRIEPVYGTAFTVNLDHILTLVLTQHDANNPQPTQTVIDVTVREYLSWPRTKQQGYQLFRQPIELPEVPTPTPAYTYGHNFARDSNANSIPNIYCFNSRKTRLDFLAGVIDAVGQIHPNAHIKVPLSTHAKTSAITWLAQSLGFSTHTKFNTTKHATEFIVSLAGPLANIPTQQLALPQPKVTQETYPLRTGFKTTELPPDDYYGFTIAGDGRFLLGDFTVTHNTGKSLAYLFPAAEFITNLTAQGLKPRVVISTASKGLQDQLAKKDFPFLTKLYPHLTCSVWKGANNYLCINKFHKLASGRKKHAFAQAEAVEYFRKHKDALMLLKNGTREELPEPVSDSLWSEICGGSPCCNKLDPLPCFKRHAYQQAQQSNIICVNHTFLSFLALYTPFIHPAEPKEEELLLIIDEGHEFLTQIRTAINKNFSISQLKALCQTLQDTNQRVLFSAELETVVNTIQSRMTEPSVHVQPHHTQFIDPLKQLSTLMYRLGYQLQQDFEWFNTAGLYFDESDKLEAQSTYKALYTNGDHLLNFLTNFPADTMLELTIDGHHKTQKLRISYKPFTHTEELSHIYSYSAYPPIITSATLLNGPTDQMLKHYCLNADQVVIRQIKGEYDYANTVKGFVFPDLGNPGDPVTLTYWLEEIIPISHGNALVLFTNRSVMEQVFQNMYLWGEAKGYRMLIQRPDTQPADLSRAMKEQPNSVVFGLKSLWTGLDIKGQNLSSLIITRLPFDPPDPYSEAYGNFLKSQGYHPFWEWALPEMLNRFRQGIGRLKRDEDDRGLIFILDPRFIKARYKPQMIGRLPLIPWTAIRLPTDLPQEQSMWLGVKPPLNAPEDIEKEENS